MNEKKRKTGRFDVVSVFQALKRKNRERECFSFFQVRMKNENGFFVFQLGVKNELMAFSFFN